MPVLNGYTTLDYIKRAKAISSTNAPEDLFIERLIEAASRAIDGEAGGRRFFPFIKARLYDIPRLEHRSWVESSGYLYRRTLLLDDDLLALTTLTNGDGTTVAASEYLLLDPNFSPHYAIRLKATSDTTWETDADASAERVISVLGEWGYHNNYTLAWRPSSTLAGALNAVNLTFNVTSGAGYTAGMIVKADNEIMVISNVNVNAITVIKRGDNGSTAAAHNDLAPLLIWDVMPDIRAACEDIVITQYNKRFGEGQDSGVATVTAAGVVINPQDISQFARGTIGKYRRAF